MKNRPSTPEEIAEDREIEEQRIAFLDAKIAALTPQLRHQLTTQLNKTAQQAFKVFVNKVIQWKLFDAPKNPIRPLDLRSEGGHPPHRHTRILAHILPTIDA